MTKRQGCPFVKSQKKRSPFKLPWNRPGSHCALA